MRLSRAFHTTVGVIAIIMLIAGAHSAAAWQCEVPLIVQPNGVQPNVLFIFDSSGSMRSMIYHDDYDGRTIYSGPFDITGSDYTVGSDADYSPDDFLGNGDTTPTARLVPSECNATSRLKGNYLNWIFYHATDEQRASLPLVTRIEVEKSVLANIVSANTGVRFGAMKLKNGDANPLVSPMGTDATTLINQVDAICAGGLTPLAGTMVEAMQYFQDTSGSAPIQYECQQNFIILLTDGYPTDDLTVPIEIGDYDGDGREPGTCESIGAEEPNSANCSDYLDDVAMYLYENDMRGDLDGKQNIVTYTIGFGIDMDLLQEAADNGNGLYFTANNAAQLEASLSSVFLDIIGRTASSSSVAVVNGAQYSGDDHIYRSRFMPVSWRGYLESFAIPFTDGDLPVWEAGYLLESRAASSRTIYTRDGNGNIVNFDTGEASVLKTQLGTADDDHAADIITFVRGDDVTGYRDRGGWKLGDIVDSTPLAIGRPAYFYDFDSYRTFAAAHASRETVVYIGANDGMFHAFRASDGYELWAYVPENNLGRLENLMATNYCHEYFNNAAAVGADIYVNGAWRTLVVSGQREGGDGYFAVDVTDPNSPVFLWDASIPATSESWGKPQIGRIATTSQFVGFVASGPAANGEAHVMAINLGDGSVIWSDQLSSIAGTNMATDPVLVDSDFDEFHDLMYVGDLGGNLWRYDISGGTWTKELLFNGTSPIQARPSATMNEYGHVLLYFGTGRYIDAADIADTSQQTMYGVIDDHSSTTLTRFNLRDQSSTITAMDPTDRGWFIDLNNAVGERMVRPHKLISGTIYAVSFAPDAATCGVGGVSWLYKVDFEDGSSPDDDDGNEDDTTNNRQEDLEEGVGSDPIFDFGNEQIIIHSSDTKLSILDTRSNAHRVVVKSWRQTYQ